MTKWRRTSIISVASLALGLFGFGGTPARALEIPIPETESNLFILDVSGSVNSVQLWKSLRNSIVAKLEQPFGSPIAKDGKRRFPVDISVTSVSKNSANSPIFTIVNKKDSKEIWGAIDIAYPRSPKARWEVFDRGFFGDKGVWTDLIKIFEQTNIVIPTSASCNSTAIAKLNVGDPFLQRAKTEQKKLILGVMCDKLIKIAKNLQSADAYFSKVNCKKNDICSDVTGAIYRSTSLAEDLARTSDKLKPALCIAVASDMLHESNGMSKTSNLNSKYIAETAATTKIAKDLGSKAAESVGIKFPTSITTRVVMVGIGSGPTPIALERNSFLLAYWEGFWTSAGVKVSNQAKSLNQACSN
jgi:hypothetical protein